MSNMAAEQARVSLPGMSSPERPRAISQTVSKDPFTSTSHIRKRGTESPEFNPTVTQMLPFQLRSNNEKELKPHEVEEAWATELLNLPEPPPEVWKAAVWLGYLKMTVLPELVGRRWDSVSKALIQTLRPSTVQLIEEGYSPPYEAMWWRVLVYLDHIGRIVRVEQEVKVPLPATIPNGKTLRDLLTDKV